jgi:hypothetical protein
MNNELEKKLIDKMHNTIVYINNHKMFPIDKQNAIDEVINLTKFYIDEINDSWYEDNNGERTYFLNHYYTVVNSLLDFAIKLEELKPEDLEIVPCGCGCNANVNPYNGPKFKELFKFFMYRQASFKDKFFCLGRNFKINWDDFEYVNDKINESINKLTAKEVYYSLVKVKDTILDKEKIIDVVKNMKIR